MPQIEPGSQPLPSLPVPPLYQTLRLYLMYQDGLLDEKARANTKRIAKNFLDSEVGQQLQQRLEELSERPDVENWLDRWWSDMYLKDRTTPAVHVSIAMVVGNHPLAEVNADRTKRATLLVRDSLKLFQSIKSRTLPADEQRGKPLCMYDYDSLFATTRIARLGRDSLFRAPKANHIVVLKRGHVFAVRVLDGGGQPYPVPALYSALCEVERLALVPSAKPSVAAMTALGRDEWATYRGKLLSSSPVGSLVIDRMESALFALCLDDGSPQEYSTGSLYWSMFGSERQMNSSSGAADVRSCNRYWDKSLNIQVAENGRAGLTFEHSGMDSVPSLRWTAFVNAAQKRDNWDGLAKEFSTPVKAASLVEPLVFDAWDEVAAKANADGLLALNKLIHQTDLHVMRITTMGTKQARALRTSPDALVQMAYQAAFRKLRGYTPSTYEAASTKMYAKGRTETLRVVTPESFLFVNALLEQEKNGSNAKADVGLAELYREAAAGHVTSIKAAGTGNGCDRHLFGLRKIAEELDIKPMPEFFRDPAYERFTNIELSTSFPFPYDGTRTIAFGPVSPRCIGVGYYLYPNSMCFCFSSWTAGEAAAFGNLVASYLKRIVTILESARRSEAASEKAGKGNVVHSNL